MARPHFWTPPSSDPKAQLLPQAGNLVEYRDETLVMLAQGYPRNLPEECRSLTGLALSVLLHRRWDDLCHLVQVRAFQAHMSAEDVEDFQQNAVFWFVEAVERYQVLPAAGLPHCQFRTFLWRVVCARLHNEVRRLRRDQKHYVYPGELTGMKGCPPLLEIFNISNSSHAGRCADGTPADPAQQAQTHELQNALQAALAELDEDGRQLIERWAAGESLAESAPTLGLSYEQAKRRWRKVLAYLRDRLREFGE